MKIGALTKVLTWYHILMVIGLNCCFPLYLTLQSRRVIDSLQTDTKRPTKQGTEVPLERI
jgi:hypothetical protein